MGKASTFHHGKSTALRDVIGGGRGKDILVLGGGVGGLSAAHEIAERGFRVRVFERKPIFGGKARSVEVPNTGTNGRKNLPGEHGFRFFPNFYKHLTDTMKRIPYPGNPAGVFDNIVPGTRAQIARDGRLSLIAVAGHPQTLEDWIVALRAVCGTSDLGIPESEIPRFNGEFCDISKLISAYFMGVSRRPGPIRPGAPSASLLLKHLSWWLLGTKWWQVR